MGRLKRRGEGPLFVTSKSKFYSDDDIHTRISETHAQSRSWGRTLLLAYGSMGVIYGDLGTSCLYVFPSVFESHTPDSSDILGAISLIFWSITLVVLLKYVLIVLRANDHGEGGTFALYTRLCCSLGINSFGSMSKEEHRHVLSASSRQLPTASSTGIAGVKAAARWLPFPAESVKQLFYSSGLARASLLGVSLLGTAMVIGDGVLTPAISVVSAVQGLSLRTPISQGSLIALCCAILVFLFMLQSLGTHRVSFLFSPVIVLWMLSILFIGVHNLREHGLQVLFGLDPRHIPAFILKHQDRSWQMLGGIMLCLTGTEAMFADLGHFSVQAVQVGFGFFVYPCLVLAYLGQGAYLMAKPEDTANAFWASVPVQYYWPMFAISTLAACVASQALITGSFSILRQAMVFSVFPKLRIVHTGRHAEGQVYIAAVNYALMLMSVGVVLGFQADSVRIGYAYGIAISTVMLITTQLLVLVMVIDWRLSSLLVTPFWLLFTLVDSVFLAANLGKVPDGGWFAVAVSLAIALLKFVWLSGQTAKKAALAQEQGSLDITEILAPLPLAPLRPPAPQQPDPRRRSLSTISRPLGTDLLPTPPSDSLSRPTSRGHPLHRPLSTGPLASVSKLCPPGDPGDPAAATAAGGAEQKASPPPPPPPFPAAALAPSAPSTSEAPPEPPPDPFFRGPKADPAAPAKRTWLGWAGAGVSSVLVRAKPPPPSPDLLTPLLPGAAEPPSPPTPGPDVEHGLTAAPEYPSPVPEERAVLAVVGGQEGLSAVARLRGVGIYYNESVGGCPPVLWHLLRNMEVVHEFAVLLTVRFLPLPHLEEKERLAAVEVPGLPNFYRVVARYGYQDIVDHGPHFVTRLVQHLTSRLARRALERPSLPGEDEFQLEVERRGAAAGLEVLRQAAREGTVHYLGVTHVRMKDLSSGPVVQLLHDLWYGGLYKPLSVNAWSAPEAWRIPARNMVELGMVVEI